MIVCKRRHQQETAAPTPCVPVTNVQWREVKPHHDDVPMTVHTRQPLHLTRLWLLVQDVMVEFLSNDLKTRKAFVLISLNGFLCAKGATVTSGCLLYLR